MQCEKCRQELDDCQCVRQMTKADHQDFQGVTVENADEYSERQRPEPPKGVRFVWQPTGLLGIAAAAVVMLAALFIALPLALVIGAAALFWQWRRR